MSTPGSQERYDAAAAELCRALSELVGQPGIVAFILHADGERIPGAEPDADISWTATWEWFYRPVVRIPENPPGAESGG